MWSAYDRKKEKSVIHSPRELLVAMCYRSLVPDGDPAETGRKCRVAVGSDQICAHASQYIVILKQIDESSRTSDDSRVCMNRTYRSSMPGCPCCRAAVRATSSMFLWSFTLLWSSGISPCFFFSSASVTAAVSVFQRSRIVRTTSQKSLSPARISSTSTSKRLLCHKALIVSYLTASKGVSGRLAGNGDGSASSSSE